MDHLGTPRTTSDANGILKTTEDLEAFGLSIPGFDASSHTHRFTGHERDSAVGLDCMHARYYGGNNARFISVDRVGDGANWYVYANNNPLRYVDANGEAPGDVARAVNDWLDRVKNAIDNKLYTERSGTLANVQNAVAVVPSALLENGLSV